MSIPLKEYDVVNIISADMLPYCIHCPFYHGKSQNNQLSYLPLNEQDTLRNDIQSAVKDGQFSIAYQSVVSLNDLNKIHGFEALLRWNHPVFGLIEPSRFIPILEETSTICRISLWVLEEALLQVKSWQQEHGVCFSLAVNISVEQFYDEFPNQVHSLLQKTNFPPHLLILEISEGKPLTEKVNAEDILNRLCNYGIIIAIDDFGTGFSSLGRLHRLPITCLKIDQSFLRQKELWEVVRWIYGFSEDFSIITEGVETIEHLKKLIEINAGKENGYAQGYFFSKPVYPEAMSEYLRSKFS